MDPLSLFTTLTITSGQAALLGVVAGLPTSLLGARLMARKTSADIWTANFATLRAINDDLRKRVDEVESHLRAVTLERDHLLALVARLQGEVDGLRKLHSLRAKAMGK